MGERDTNGDAIAERRGFVQRFDAHEAVQRVDFTRDGFRTIFIELEHRPAVRPLEAVGPDASSSLRRGSPVLFQTGDRAPG